MVSLILIGVVGIAWGIKAAFSGYRESTVRWQQVPVDIESCGWWKVEAAAMEVDLLRLHDDAGQCGQGVPHYEVELCRYGYLEE